MITVFKVCIPHTSRDYFDYYSDTLNPSKGARVWVPFRNKIQLGIVLAVEEREESHYPLKAIASVIDEKACLPESLLTLCQWVSHYYQSPLSEVLPLALPKAYRQGKEMALPQIIYYQLAMTAERAYVLVKPQARKQRQLIDFLNQQKGACDKPSLQQAGFSSLQIQALVVAGIVATQTKNKLPIEKQFPRDHPLQLHPEQADAIEAIHQRLGKYQCFLLQGVTGSGKTEVYLQVIAKVLQEKGQVLVLVPEIGLTPQLLARFKARFHEPMAVIHSHLNEHERQLAWQRASDGQVRLVIGTRTAVFTPMPQLGLIVIDEEHDSSLKQMEGVRYSARDTALMRAYLANCPIVLGSATPTLETLYNCERQKYQLLRLTQKALSTSSLHFQLIDLRHLPLQQGIAATTLTMIDEHLKQQNQVLVFINRRGFAPILLCHHCGWMADCRACDSHLTLHRQAGYLICHHCGLTQRIITQCSHCQGKELIPVGAGTQRIFDYLQTKFPTINMVRIDRDEVRQKDALEKQLERIHRGEAQLIVGTQMLAKGHHFPRLTLVVILEADAGFYNQDFRAIEHLGQLLIQVSGRAGRAELAGQVVIQTHLPQHPLLNTLIREGYDAFSRKLLVTRQAANLPPYHYLAVIRAQHNSINKVLSFLHAIKEQLMQQDVEVLGPAPAPLARKAHQHRMQLLIKSSSRKQLQFKLTALREWLAINKLANGIRWGVDVDPVDLT